MLVRTQWDLLPLHGYDHRPHCHTFVPVSLSSTSLRRAKRRIELPTHGMHCWKETSLSNPRAWCWTWSLFWSQTLSLSSKAINWMYIFEKRVWNKGDQRTDMKQNPGGQLPQQLPNTLRLPPLCCSVSCFFASSFHAQGENGGNILRCRLGPDFSLVCFILWGSHSPWSFTCSSLKPAMTFHTRYTSILSQWEPSRHRIKTPSSASLPAGCLHEASLWAVVYGIAIRTFQFRECAQREWAWL